MHRALPSSGNITFLLGYPLGFLGRFGNGLHLRTGLFRLEFDPDRRTRLLRVMGLSAIFLFPGTAIYHIYGDPLRWQPGATATQTLMSFFNVLKYPPSLLFLLITLGPVLLMLSWLQTTAISAENPLGYCWDGCLYFISCCISRSSTLLPSPWP